MRAPQEVEAHVCLLALVHVSNTTVAGARHARDQGQIVGVAALCAACAHPLDKVVADGAAAVLGGQRTVVGAAVVVVVEGLCRKVKAESSRPAHGQHRAQAVRKAACRPGSGSAT